MSAPVVVRTVTHREKNDRGQRFGHVGYIQHRAPAKRARYGGKPFASWARLTIDGIETGCAERFETYDTRAEAAQHARYAAGRLDR
jgi:hypothetical protein